MSWLLVKDLETEMKWHVETSKRCSYLSISLVSGFLHRNPIVKFFVSNLCCRYEIKIYLRHMFAHLLFYLAHGQKSVPFNLGQIVVFDKRVRGCLNQDVHMI